MAAFESQPDCFIISPCARSALNSHRFSSLRVPVFPAQINSIPKPPRQKSFWDNLQRGI